MSEQRTMCAELIRGDFGNRYPCPHRGKLEHNGKWWCGLHHPPTVEKKRAARDAAWQAKWDAEREARAAKQKQAALNEAKLALYPELVQVARDAESYSQMQKSANPIFPDDPRYTQLIGEWNGYQAPETRWQLWNERRKATRRETLAKAEAIERGE